MKCHSNFLYLDNKYSSERASVHMAVIVQDSKVKCHILHASSHLKKCSWL